MTVGFCGALVIVRPGGVPLDIGIAFAAGSGAAYALYIVITRKVSADDSPTTISERNVVLGDETVMLPIETVTEHLGEDIADDDDDSSAGRP